MGAADGLVTFWRSLLRIEYLISSASHIKSWIFINFLVAQSA